MQVDQDKIIYPCFCSIDAQNSSNLTEIVKMYFP